MERVWKGKDKETVIGTNEAGVLTIVSLYRLAVDGILAIGREQGYKVPMVICLVGKLVVLLKEVDDGCVFDRCRQVWKFNAHPE